MPDSLAIWVDSSQFLQTFDKKSMEGEIEKEREEGEVDEDGLSSVNISSPLSP
jgi:hypothetical protein